MENDTPISTEPSVITEPDNNKKKLFIFAIIIVLVSLIGGFYYLKSQAKQQNISQPTLQPSSGQAPTIQPNEFVEWKTYESKQYGFQVAYPPELTLQESEYTIFDTKQTRLLISNGEFSLEISGDKGGRGVGPIKRSEIIIAGIKTDKFYETEQAGVIKAIQSPNNHEIYFSFTLPTDPEKALKKDTLIDKILSTFRFTTDDSLSSCASAGLKISVSYPKNSWNCKVEDLQGAESIKLTSTFSEISISTNKLGRGFFCDPVKPEDICYVNSQKGISRGGQCNIEPEEAFSCEVVKFYSNPNIYLETYKLAGKIGEIFGYTKRDKHYVSVMLTNKNVTNLSANDSAALLQVLSSIKEN